MDSGCQCTWYQLEPRIKDLLRVQRHAISEYLVPDGVIECGASGVRGVGGDAFTGIGMLFAVDAVTGKLGCRGRGSRSTRPGPARRRRGPARLTTTEEQLAAHGDARG